MDNTKVLLQELRRMDANAFAHVFDLYAPVIYRYVFHNCHQHSLADQIVGEVFVRLLEQLSLGKGPISNIHSYLFEIAYHCIVDEVRQSHWMTPISTVGLKLQSANYIDITVEEHMLVELIKGVIKNKLTDDQRHVIILRFLEGFSLKETALIMGKEVGNIKVIQNRAIASLRKTLDYQELEYTFVDMSIPAVQAV